MDRLNALPAPSPSVFVVRRRRSRRRTARLLLELIALTRSHPGKVPVLILGKDPRLVVMHGDDCSFLREELGR